jgi:hypothetical protein
MIHLLFHHPATVHHLRAPLPILANTNRLAFQHWNTHRSPTHSLRSLILHVGLLERQHPLLRRIFVDAQQFIMKRSMCLAPHRRRRNRRLHLNKSPKTMPVHRNSITIRLQMQCILSGRLEGIPCPKKSQLLFPSLQRHGTAISRVSHGIDW